MAQVIYGRIPVLNALKGARKPKVVYLFKDSPDKRIQSACIENKVHFRLVDRQVLDRLSDKANHQGALAEVDDFEYASFAEELAKIKNKEKPLVLLLDGLNDPINFGGILRSAAAFGVDFIVIRKEREISVTPTVVKISTGASEIIPICQVTNLSSAIKTLKEHGFWLVATTDKGESYYDEINYDYPIALVIGNEGFGISQKVLEAADFTARIPMPGPISSLNASVATAVFLAAIVEQRRKKNSN